MSAHHNTNSIQHLYEGDQSKLYSGVMQHHTDIASPESKKQVGRIWRVFWILLIVTVVEVLLGMYGYQWGMPRGLTNAFFLILTLFKASFIVSVFMHLGDEIRSFLIMVLIPLTLFIWFVIAFLADGGFWLHMNSTAVTR
ncbi:MAG: cytochrome C oxidase subunit IV family protein [Bacteroidetes bacterium]|nr:cytochrome C oxidase subunit IV family protein [Bacteroidota bacterium]MBS1781241.1 cytochrome C oxidase subunit IV family protein [Bacteroidota bacterium]